MTASKTKLVGMDGASQRSKFGYALGYFDPGSAGVVVEQAGLLGDAEKPIPSRILPYLGAGGPVLVAIDAPLGWPDGLRQMVCGHVAGGAPPVDLKKDNCFRRHSDTEIQSVKKPLEVAADRIARAAFEALRVLNELRTGSGLGLPLAWSPDVAGASVIEVYPGATLAAGGLAVGPYKGKNDRPARVQLLQELTRAGRIAPLSAELTDRALGNADILDAMLCMVAASDFLLGKCKAPGAAFLEQAQREGWIWVRGR